MSEQIERSETEDRHAATHLTTRRGFVTAVSFGVVSLYGLWAAYGAAPTSLAFLSNAGSGGMKGMGHGGGGMSVDEFRRLTTEFIEANSLPDGSVKPIRHAATKMSVAERHPPSGEMQKPEHGGGHDDDHAARAPAPAEEMHQTERGEEPIDVYVIATRYGYEPDLLRLEAGMPYRFRMMAVDADHGASFNFRIGSRMIRARAKTLTELKLVFPRPGEFMVYCTVYCGEGHDMMMGQIVVA